MQHQFLKLNQLRFVEALARLGKLALAAEQLHISQPAASRTLAEIEALVGRQICARNAHGVVFNELGKALAARARRVISEMDQLGRDLVELADGRHGKVRIGAVTTAAIAYALPAAVALREIAPRVQLQIDVEPSVTLMQRMRGGDYDFVIGRLMPNDEPGLYDVRQIGEETIGLVVRAGHPLAGARGIRLEDVARHDWIVQPVGTPMWLAVANAFQAQGVRFPENVTSTASILLTLAAISRTDAIATLSQRVIDLLAAPELGVRISALDTSARIVVPAFSIITQRDAGLSPVALRFLDYIEQAISADRDEDYPQHRG